MFLINLFGAIIVYPLAAIGFAWPMFNPVKWPLLWHALGAAGLATAVWLIRL